jgi:hypothetical protein
MGTASGNIASGISFDRCDTTYNADFTVATETLYRGGVAVGVLTYTYVNGLQTKVVLTSAVFSS